MGAWSNFWNRLFGLDEEPKARTAKIRKEDLDIIQRIDFEAAQERAKLDKMRLAQETELRRRELRVHRDKLNAQKPFPIKTIEPIVKAPQSLTGRPNTVPIKRITTNRRLP